MEISSYKSLESVALQCKRERDMYRSLLSSIVRRWAEDIDNDEPINGGDAVDYLVELVETIRKTVRP